FDVPTNDALSRKGSGTPIFLDPTALATFYVRRTFASELDMTLLGGVTEAPGNMHLGTYLSYRFDERMALDFSAMTNFNKQSAWAVYGGIRIYFVPLPKYSLISGNPENRYRPFLRTIDHINFQVKKRIANL